MKLNTILNHLCVLAALTLSSHWSVAQQSSSRNEPINDHELYSKLYGAHIEVCGASRYKEKTGAAGGIGGHAFTYVHGLCRDLDSTFPQVKPCSSQDNHQGVGISVNSDFKNVNWVAIPGYHNFFDGNVKSGEVVNFSKVKSMANWAVQNRLFKNVKIKEELTEGLTFGSHDYESKTALNSVGTDYATRFARSLRCARIPIQKSKLSEIADTLNKLNQYYFLENHVYNWSGAQNNCTHTANDILAAAGIREPVLRNQGALAYLNLTVPRNAAYRAIQIAVVGSGTPNSLYTNKNYKFVNDIFWTPLQVGSLSKFYTGFTDNDFFDISSKALWVLPNDLNLLRKTMTSFDRPEYSDIFQNILYWEQKYQTIEKKLTAQKIIDLSSKQFRSFSKKYLFYIQSQKNKTTKLKETYLKK